MGEIADRSSAPSNRAGEAGDTSGAAERIGRESPRTTADAEERRLAWMYLSRVLEGPCPALSELISRVGVREAARAVRECALPESLRGPTERRRGVDRVERDLEVMARIGGRVITPDDDEWPQWRMLGLAQLDPARDPEAAVPLVLWARGPLSLRQYTEQALAVVGARCSTGYGEQAAAELAGDMAAAGWTIISGAAFGIDGTAHRAALTVGGNTIAVLACGIDRPYPAQHERLLAEIAETGVVVSEYPPGAAAYKHRFLARNRLIAALSDGVLVVEAGARSGARNTAKWARRLGRPALAVPGPITAAASAGCHRMIREGEAILVTRIEEVCDEVGPLRLPLPTGRVEPRLDGDQETVFAALPVAGARQPTQLAEDCGLDVAAVRAALVALEVAGLVGVDSSGWFRTVRTGG
ncbi:MAG: DNA-processing protein DprA [Nocardia sp.]|nr:DNA-processing protein DprA [Nocardia sp.]